MQFIPHLGGKLRENHKRDCRKCSNNVHFRNPHPLPFPLYQILGICEIVDGDCEDISINCKRRMLFWFNFFVSLDVEEPTER